MGTFTVIGLLLVVLIVLIYLDAKRDSPLLPLAKMLRPRYPEHWRCVGMVNHPVRRINNVNNDLVCMSIDGKNCIPGNCSENIDKYYGMNRMHDAYQVTCTAADYAKADHWCNVADKQYPKGTKLASDNFGF